MNVVQIEVSDDLRRIIDRRIAAGTFVDEADFLATAAQLFAEHLVAEDEMAELVARADADITAGRYVTVSTEEDSQALHEAAMTRLRACVAEGDAAG